MDLFVARTAGNRAGSGLRRWSRHSTSLTSVEPDGVLGAVPGRVSTGGRVDRPLQEHVGDTEWAAIVRREQPVKRNNAPTERLFGDAGISEGMSILELGCGPGEVTEMIADMVGPAGRVLAVDRSEEMLSAARERTGRNTERNIRFVCADLNDGPEYLEDLDHASLDAIAGRRVLMYLPDPRSVVAGLMPWVAIRRAGGIRGGGLYDLPRSRSHDAGARAGGLVAR